MMSTNERSPWEDLPADILELILQRLTVRDYRICREICTCWRYLVDNAANTRCPSLPQLPFLLSLPLPLPPPSSRLSLFSLSCDNPSKLVNLSSSSSSSPIRNHSKGVQSAHGWLMFHTLHDLSVNKYLDYRFNISFLNPVSHARFNLPELKFSTSMDWHLCLHKFASESTPDSPDFCVVVSILVLAEEISIPEQRLALFRPTQNSWTHYIYTEKMLRDIVVHKGKLYGIVYQDWVYHVCVTNLENHGHDDAVEPQRLLFKFMGSSASYQIALDSTFVNAKLTVDTCCGEVLLVLRMLHVNEEAENFRRSSKFRVLKVDLGGSSWSEVKDLGDRFLFWDSTGVRVVHARGGLVASQEFNGGNCIFYTTSNKDRVGVFFFADKRHRDFDAPSLLGFQSMWFTPSPW